MLRIHTIAFPRLDCLGLIEAGYTGDEPKLYSRFRGLIASASLKPHRAQRLMLPLSVSEA